MPTPRPEHCGHCGEKKNCVTQMHYLLCLDCGKQSNLDGTPIEGNGHFYANQSESFPWTRDQH